MNKQNHNFKHSELEKQVEQKYRKREKKKKTKMKVSGASVRNLQRLIAKK